MAWLRTQGVTSEALAEPELPRRAQVVFRPDAPLFDFAENGDDGAEAPIFITRDDAGEPADPVAWSCRLGKVAAHFGAVAVLGADDILAPRLSAKAALPVHRTPLGWLRAGRAGIVILAECAAVALRDFGPFAAEDEAHGRELRRLFRRREPRIFVHETRAAA
jgi:hypothetical protein